MAGKNTAVFGIYKSSAQAERAVDRIVVAGFSNNDISVLLPDSRRESRRAERSVERSAYWPESAL
jgi:hypothetical protein